MGLDLSNIPSTATVESRGLRFELLDETGKPYEVNGAPICATVFGTYSPAFTNVRSALERRMKHAVTAADREDISRERYAAVVKEWDITAHGKPADPKKIFELKPHIFEQVIMKANDHGAHATAWDEAETQKTTPQPTPLVIVENDTQIAA